MGPRPLRRNGAGTAAQSQVSHYRIRPRAAVDLAEHFSNIARDKLAPADRFLKIAENSFARLAAMPGIGRVWESPESLLQGVRVYPLPSPYRSYLVFYRISEERAVEILAVLHAARDIGALIEDLL